MDKFINRLADFGGNPIIQAPLRAMEGAGSLANKGMKGLGKIGAGIGNIAGKLSGKKASMAQKMQPQKGVLGLTQNPANQAVQNFGSAGMKNMSNYYNSLKNY